MKSLTLTLVASLISILISSGCTSTTSSNTARTGKEQLLISNSVDQALQSMDFTAFQGSTVHLEEKYLDCVDKGYVIGSLRHRIVRQGAILAPSADDADVIVEVRSGGVGTDTSDSYIGIPEVVLPGVITLPEVRLLSKNSQQGTAKLALMAYDAKTMQPLGEGGISLTQSDDNNWYFMGVGPVQTGSLRSEVGSMSQFAPGTYHSDIPRYVAFVPPEVQEPGEIRLTAEQTDGEAAAQE
jgi:hypothetical protein